MRNPVDFLLNKDDKQDQVVAAPAFSLTKVLTIAAPVVTAVAALLAKAVENVDFSAGQITAMIIAVIGLVTIAGSADMLARSVATKAKAEPAEPAEPAEVSEPVGMVRLATPIRTVRAKSGADENVTTMALSVENPPRFLCLHQDGSLTWEKESDLRFSGTAVVGVGSNGQP